MKNLGDDLTDGDIDDMIADVDTDGSGWVDYNGQSPASALLSRPSVKENEVININVIR